MKTSKSSGTFRPFEDLKVMLKCKSLSPGFSSVEDPDKKILQTCDSEHGVSKPSENILNKQASENELFLEAMADVKPIPRGDRIEHSFISSPPAGPDHDSEN